MNTLLAGVTLVDPFPFSDLDKLEAEEDELPTIPEWPTIFANGQRESKSSNIKRD